MPSVTRFLTLAAMVVVSLSIGTLAQTLTVIPDTEAAQHVGQHLTVEGVVVKVFTSKQGNALRGQGNALGGQSLTYDISPIE